ncbi:MAG: cupin domain-containing protein [Polaromonas sp.]|nr:cupin domain-containing protein [Polaromonas sp.]
MSPAEFEATLKADNFGEIVPVERPAGYAMGEHTHTFDACALITSGEFTLQVNGVSTTYAAGDIFRLSAGTPHHESAGPAGATYLAGRREMGAS